MADVGDDVGLVLQEIAQILNRARPEVRDLVLEALRSDTLIPGLTNAAQLQLCAILDPSIHGHPSSEFVQRIWEANGGEKISRWTATRLTALERLCIVLRGFRRREESLAQTLERYLVELLASPLLNGNNELAWKMTLNWAIFAYNDKFSNKPPSTAMMEERIRKALDGEYRRIPKAAVNGAPSIAPSSRRGEAYGRRKT